MKVITIIQARTTSTRLPNKVLIEIYGKSLLERVIDQASKIKNTDEVWVATSTHENDDLIEILCERKKVPCYRGDLEDVRGRFYTIAKNQDADIIVRITADNPFTNPVYAEELIDYLKENIKNCDHVSMDKSTVLDGSNSEVFTMKALEQSVSVYRDAFNKEHVTPALVQHMKTQKLVSSYNDLIAKNSYFIGVDTFADLKRATQLFMKYGEKDTLQRIIKKINKNEKAI